MIEYIKELLKERTGGNIKFYYSGDKNFKILFYNHDNYKFTESFTNIEISV